MRKVTFTDDSVRVDPEELARQIVQLYYPEMTPSYRGRRLKVAQAAIIATAEAAAQIVEEHGETWGLSYLTITNTLAAAIRERATGGPVDRRNFGPLAAAWMKESFGLDVSIVSEATPNAQHFAIVGAWGAPKPITDEQMAAFRGFCAGWFAAHGVPS